MTTPRRARVTARLTGLAAAVTILAILVGLPALLLAVGGIPDRMPTIGGIVAALTRPDDGTLAVTGLILLGWACWLVLAGAVLAELIAGLRGRTAPTLPGLALPQGAARALVASAALLFTTTPVTTPMYVAATMTPSVTTTQPAPPTPVTGANGTTTGAATGTRHAGTLTGAASHRSAAGTTPAERNHPDTTGRSAVHVVRTGESLWSIAEHTLGAGSRYPEIAALNRDVLGDHPDFLTPDMRLRLPTNPAAPHPGDATGTTYIVKPGDTLSQIAREQLGDPNRYPEIFHASRQVRQPGGARLTDPDIIDIGWHLTIPSTTATGHAQSPTHARDPAPNNGTASKRHLALPGGESTAPAPRRKPTDPTPGTDDTAPAPAAGGATPTATVPATERPPATSSAPGPPAVGAGGATGDDAATTGEGSITPGWLLTGLTGAGTILAGSMLLVLRARRRAQFRARRPGRTIATPDAQLAPVEKTLTLTGRPATVTVEWLDQVLRRLAAAQAGAGAQMPPLVAVELDATDVTLHLAEPHDAPPPWQVTHDGRAWQLPTSTGLDEIGPDLPDQPAPYPLLVTIGSADTGATWLIDAEQVTPMSITGDPTYGRDLARYLTAELACNPWSYGVTVHCVGIADELTALNPDRVHAAGTAEAAIAATLAEATATVDRAQYERLDVPTARAAQAGADPWHATLLLLDDTTHEPALQQLRALLAEHPARTATALLQTTTETTTQTTAGSVEVRVTDTGRVAVPSLGLDLVAVGLTPDEAKGCAALLAQADDRHDEPIPAKPHPDGWRSLADEAGSIRAEHTTPRDHLHSTDDQGDLAGTSILDLRDEEYLHAAATTREDLDRLAPAVTEQTRARVQDSDPDLDQDLDTWFSEECDLPRLTLLGPVRARTRGIALTKRKPYYTELLAYLATRPHGVTPDEVADAFSITNARVRNDIKIVRDWLGTNPRTGHKHLPDAREAPAAKARGVAVYQVDAVLTDIDLFRRLRLRGETRGPDGITDLTRALTLVHGRPFDQLRPGGWTWLLEGDRLDHHALCAIVDVAHLVTTHALTTGDHPTARAAAELACLAAPHEEIPRLDLAAVAAAEGHHAEAERITREDICSRSDEPGAPPDDLPDRTRQILEHHQALFRPTTHAAS